MKLIDSLKYRKTSVPGRSGYGFILVSIDLIKNHLYIRMMVGFRIMSITLTSL